MKSCLPVPVVLVLLSFAASAQQYYITTIAGAERFREGEGAPTVPLRDPLYVTGDNQGNVYIADQLDYRVRKLSPTEILTTAAGNGIADRTGDGGSAKLASINEVAALATEGGSIYLSLTYDFRIRKVDPSGTITNYAGNGGAFYEGDGGLARNTAIYPVAIAADGRGNLYLYDMSSTMTFSGGQVEIALGSRIRKIDSGGYISTIAGSEHGFSGDGGPARSAQISMVTGMTVDPEGNLYLCDNYNHRIRRIGLDGTINTIAGTGSPSYNGDGRPAVSASLDPYAIAADTAGNLYIADPNNHRVRKISAGTGLITTVAGNGTYGFDGDGGPATAARLANPASVWVDASGNLFIADRDNDRVRRVSPDGIIRTVAGTPCGDTGPASEVYLSRPWGVFVDTQGRILVADAEHHRVRRIDASGEVRTVAGSGYSDFWGYSDGGGVATMATLKKPYVVAEDQSGNIYISGANSRIHRVTPQGSIATVAGTGKSGYSGDGAEGTRAMIGNVTGLAIDSSGALYFSDLTNRRVRKLTASGTISTVAGNGKSEFSGDGGPAIAAQLHPMGLAFDKAGDLYVADMENNRIRKIAAGGVITTVAGNGTKGYTGDGGPAVSASLASPIAIAFDREGNLLISDCDNQVVRRVSTAGVISTIAGNRGMVHAGDGGPALSAQLDPFGIALDGQGNILVADRFNDHIRRLHPHTASRVTVTGGNGQSGAAGSALPSALTVKVVDIAGFPVQGVTVTFALTAGAATLSPSSTTTAADGTASTQVTLGATPGQVTVTATVSGLRVATFDLTAQASAPAPKIWSGGIVSAGLSSPPVRAISPGAIMTIFGENFVPAGPLRRVDSADLVNGRLPTRFASICVLVDGEPAPIFAVISGQVNFQAPRLPGSGTVRVQVVSNCGSPAEVSSAVESVPVQPAAPEFFYVLQHADGKNPVAGTHVDTGFYIGAEGLIPGGAFAPAKPGEILTLYLTGLGATDPEFSPGELPAGAASARGRVRVQMGAVTLPAEDVLYAGVAPLNAGLYQINLRVPATLPDGDQPIHVSVDEVASPPGAFITIRR